MTRYAIIGFEHDRREAREDAAPLCRDLDIDVSVPWSWIEATIDEVPISTPAKNRAERALLAFVPRSCVVSTAVALAETAAKVAVFAERYQPACPACKESLRYVAWSVEDYEDD